MGVIIMKHISYSNEVKPINSKEYMEYMNTKGFKGYVSHAVHAEPKWNTEHTEIKASVGVKEQIGATKPSMTKNNAYNENNKKCEVEGQIEQTQPKEGATTHMDCMSGINNVNMVIMGPAYFYMHAKPITEYCFRQAQIVGVRDGIKEAILIGLLVGMGFDHQQAYMIADKWKSNYE